LIASENFVTIVLFSIAFDSCGHQHAHAIHSWGVVLNHQIASSLRSFRFESRHSFVTKELYDHQSNVRKDVLTGRHLVALLRQHMLLHEED